MTALPQTPPPEADVRRFPGWELHMLTRELWVKGAQVKIGDRAWSVLCVLAEAPGEVLSKDTLLERAWPRTVAENNLTVQISTLRAVLGDRVIITVPGVGYRLACRPEPGPPGVGAHEPATARAAEPVPPYKAPALIGREHDEAALRPLVGQVPLLTLVGPGGVGKTSLARELLAHAGQGWRDGVHWLDLAPLREGAAVTRRVAQALGVALDSPGVEDLMSTPVAIEALIVLDNCEHLLGACAELVAQALRQMPGVRWLATSQSPLHVAGECVYRLEPLALPAHGATMEEALRSGALALFVLRASAADQRFTLESSQLGLAVDICHRLDGLPLALEMAAARVAALGLQAVQAQLGQRLRLRAGAPGTPARQQMLLQTYAWSCGLLPPAGQRLFRRLEPFRGGFTSDLVERVCCGVPGDAEPMDPWDAMELLALLVEKSLVRRTPGPPDRFGLLESGRDYALLQLQEAGELQALHLRHAQALADWFDGVQGDFDRVADRVWLARCRPERPNIHAALTRVCEWRTHPDLLARLVVALARIDALALEQAAVVQCGVPLDVLDQAAPRLRAAARIELGWAHYQDGRRDLGSQLTLQALADFEAIGDTTGIYRALAHLIRLYEARPGMLEQARQMYVRLEAIDDKDVPMRTRLHCVTTAGFQYGGRNIARLTELHEVAQRLGFDVQAAVCRTHITDELLLQQRFEDAVIKAQELLRDDDDRPRAGALLRHNQALALVQLGRLDEARTAALAALRALPAAAHMIVDLFALAAARAGRHTDAALLAGYGAEVKRQRDLRSDPAEAAVIAETLQTLRAALQPGTLERLLREGATMSAGEALAKALATD